MTVVHTPLPKSVHVFGPKMIAWLKAAVTFDTAIPVPTCRLAQVLTIASSVRTMQPRKACSVLENYRDSDKGLWDGEPYLLVQHADFIKGFWSGYPGKLNDTMKMALMGNVLKYVVRGGVAAHGKKNLRRLN